MRAIAHKPQPFLARAREAFGLLRGKQQASNYRVQDLQNLVQYVIKSERNRNFARNGFRNEAGTYDGARTGRTREDWGYATDVPYNELSGAHGILVARSRNLYKNDSTYRAAINMVVTNVIGTGLRPKPKVLGKDGKPDKTINKAIEKAFWKYARRQEWDARKKMHWVGEGQRLALKTILVSGDFIMNAVTSRDGAFLPVMWQQTESDRLDTTHDMLLKQTWQSENIKQTIHGINLDEFGAPVSYLFKGISSAVPAKNIIHSFMASDRPEQYIGIPAAVAALDEVFDLQDLKEDYVLKSRAIAKVLWWLSTKMDDGIPNAGDQDADSVIGLEPLSQMRTEEAPELLKMPDSVSDTVLPLVEMLQHGICSNLGTSYSTVTRNMKGVNYAASQGVDNVEWKISSMVRDYFIDDYCDPFYEKAVLLMIIKGEIPGVTPTVFAKNPYDFYEVEWFGNGRLNVDPLKDIQADNEGLKSGAYTMHYVVGKRGGDFDEHTDTLMEERAVLKEKGLEDLIERQAGTKTMPEAATTSEELAIIEPVKPKAKSVKNKKQKEAVNA
jgi:lambda family phage portal protein